MKKVVALALLYSVVACSDTRKDATPDEAWNQLNNPFNFSAQYERAFTGLPTAGQLDKKPWSDNYWPSYQGGIAVRWAEPRSNAFTYTTPSRDALRNMTAEQIARLSPAEKYDIYNGNYDYPTVRSERARTSPNRVKWEGICQGWAAAAFLYEEPQPVRVTNPDGITIPFGSSDVKALLAYYHAIVSSTASAFVGTRCYSDLTRNPSAGTRPECRDTNAGAFHIVLTNQIGRMKRSFLVDITRGAEIWNQPVYSYRTQILRNNLPPSVGSAPGTEREIHVLTEMVYTVELPAAWTPYVPKMDRKTYEYRLELDGTGTIIGGEWISTERPDFLWDQKRPVYQGYFAKVEEIYTASVGGQGATLPASTPTPEAQPTTVPTAAPTVAEPNVTPTPIDSIPTVLPTPVAEPTPVTTPAAPVVTPTVLPEPSVPNLTPTPEGNTVPQPHPLPSANPSQPGNNGTSYEAYYCPSGYRAVRYGGVWACVEIQSGQTVRGPFPQPMVEACNAQYGARMCFEGEWPSQVFFHLRGTSHCPVGTSALSGSPYCADNFGFVFGPFPASLVQQCKDAGFGASCDSLMWNISVIRALTAN